MEQMHSVQMVMLTAPDLLAVTEFYVDFLGFRVATRTADEAVVEGYGMQVVFSPGEGGKHRSPPAPARAAIEIPVAMPRIESVWERDRARDPDTLGPMLDPSGVFVYVTLDPANNAVALVSPLPTERDENRQERVTQKMRRPDV